MISANTAPSDCNEIVASVPTIRCNRSIVLAFFCVAFFGVALRTSCASVVSFLNPARFKAS